MNESLGRVSRFRNRFRRTRSKAVRSRRYRQVSGGGAVVRSQLFNRRVLRQSSVSHRRNSWLRTTSGVRDNRFPRVRIPNGAVAHVARVDPNQIKTIL